MFYSLKEGKVNIGCEEIDYVAFGKGHKNLVIVQGLNLRDIKGSGLSLAIMYKLFAKEYRVCIFDRRHQIKEGFTNWDIADDVAKAMAGLGVAKADFLGISQGGMISMAMAINYPNIVNKLVLGVTASKPNKTMEKVIGRWVECADRKDHIAINNETFSLMYTDEYLKKYKMLMPVLIRLVKPKDFKRFSILASAAGQFDCYERLTEIKCPVLVLGGQLDKITTARASEEIAEKIGCEVYIYPEYGHAAYDEAKDFNQRVYEFLTEK